MKKKLLLFIFILFNFISGQNMFSPKERDKNIELLELINNEKILLLKSLKTIVEMESFSDDDKGLTKLGEYLKKSLEDLGGKVEFVKPLGSAKGKNILAKFKGEGKTKILLMAHMDTVYPKGSFGDSLWKVEGDRIYGPGVGDAKSGIAVILHTLSLLNKLKYENYDTITVIFNTDEEIGSEGSKDLISKEAKNNDVILSYEPTYANYECLVMNTSGTGKVKVTVKGLNAHAGANPDSGVNAIVEAADIISRTKEIDEGTGGVRFSWTAIQSGSEKTINIIPDETILYADLRFPSNEKLNEVLENLEKKINQKKIEKSEIIFEFTLKRPAFNTNEKGKILIQDAVDIYNSLGKKLELLEHTGGGTDAGHAMASGKPILEGLGLPGENAHSAGKEWINTEGIPRRLYLSTQMIIDICDKKLLD